MGSPQSWRTMIPRKFSHCCKGSGFPWLGILVKWLRIPRVCDFEGQWDLAAGLYIRFRGNRESTPGWHIQNLVCTRTQGKEAVIPQETEPDLPASAGESPVGAWDGSGSSWGQGNWQQQQKQLIGMNPTGGHHYPYHRAYRLHGWLFSAETTNREWRAAHLFSRQLD